ncbi:hypothetical protein [Mesorhizobium sp.]|uniref:hypothetical protein n=2 Tax=Mesorhizobium TaxID=68287 RepID=UPI00257D0240|nr:hypothetical protein [Mesorhizobium sp.]
MVLARDLRMTVGNPICRVSGHLAFSFLRGASSCEELFAQATMIGIEALAVVDRKSLAGIVRA